MKKRKLFQKILSGPRSVQFSDMLLCAEAFGFILSIVSGSHHIFVHPAVPELLNIQNADGKAKPYQIKQLLQIVEKYDLQLEVDE